VSRTPLLADGETSRTACARTLLRRAVDEKTGERLSLSALSGSVRKSFGG